MRTESIFALTAAASLALSAGALHADTALTIYSSAQPGGIPAEWYRPVPGQNNWVNHSNIPGYAVVKEDRAIAFDRGEGELSFTGVAALLDPTTVSFVSLDDPATKVLEQDYRFDLVSNEKLIQRFIDRPVTVMTTQGAGRMAHSGTLLSASGGLVLQKDTGGIVTIRDYDTIDFPSLPGGLLTKPTLVWKTWSPEGGEQDTRLSYQTTGITWWADYNLVFTPGADANSGTVDVGAWVSILNKSGGAYEDAKLKLVAGEVNRAPVFQPARGRGGGCDGAGHDGRRRPEGLRGKVVLRVPPLHAGASRDDPRELDQAARAVRGLARACRPRKSSCTTGAGTRARWGFISSSRTTRTTGSGSPSPRAASG
jgi:hypothetical protein